MLSALPSSNNNVYYRSSSTGLLSTGPSGQQLAGMVAVSSDMVELTAAAAKAAAAANKANAGAQATNNNNNNDVNVTINGDGSAGAGEQVQLKPLLGLTKYKYSRLNLTINEHGEYDSSPGSSIVRSHRNISMFWQEKLGLLLFFLQLHALIWLQCYQFYPKYWREYWRWTLIFILDVHNLIKDSGGSNTGGDTVFHSFFILLLPLASLAIYQALNKFVYADRIAGSTREDTHRVSYLQFQRWALLYAEQLYVPVCLLWFRMWTCGVSDEMIYINKDWQCWTLPHFIIIGIVTLGSGFVMLSMPWIIYQRMKKIVVFHDGTTHERYLQSRELEYLMGCNNLYEYTFFFYIGSYSRFWAFSRLFQLFQKLVLCLFLISLNRYNTSSSSTPLLIQSLLFLLIISGPTMINFFHRAYRCPSSNYIKAILDAVMFFTCVMNVIEADPNGFTSSFIDQYTFSYMLLLINCVGLFFVLLLCAIYLMQERRALSAASASSKSHSSSAVSSSPSWPVCPSDLVALYLVHPEMIVHLNMGKRLLEESANIPEEFYPIHTLLATINQMRALLADAKERREGRKTHAVGAAQGGGSIGGGANAAGSNANGSSAALSTSLGGNAALNGASGSNNGNGASGAAGGNGGGGSGNGLSRRSGGSSSSSGSGHIFTRAEEVAFFSQLRVGEEKSLCLEWTLQDMVEDLALLYNTIVAHRKQNEGSKNNAGSATAAHGNADSARVDRLSLAFDGFSLSLQQSQHSRLLMHPLKSHFLAKMLFVAGMVQTSNANFLHGARPAWKAPLFLQGAEEKEREEEERIALALAQAKQIQQQQQAAAVATQAAQQRARKEEQEEEEEKGGQHALRLNISPPSDEEGSEDDGAESSGGEEQQE